MREDDVDDENGSEGDEYGEQSMGGGDSGGPPPIELPPGAWRGYHAGNDAAALTGALNDAWAKRPQNQSINAADIIKIVAHGNNPITGYSVIMKGHGP